MTHSFQRLLSHNRRISPLGLAVTYCAKWRANQRCKSAGSLKSNRSSARRSSMVIESERALLVLEPWNAKG